MVEEEEFDMSLQSEELESLRGDGSFIQDNEKAEQLMSEKSKQSWKVYFGF